MKHKEQSANIVKGPRDRVSKDAIIEAITLEKTDGGEDTTGVIQNLFQRASSAIPARIRGF